MDFISWLVVGVLFMLAEFGVGSFYLLAIGLACIYPSITAYTGAPTGTQLAAAGLGAMVHALIVLILRKLRPATVSETPSDVGQRVEIIEWLDECTARVMYRGREWEADKVKSEMPDASHGIIQSVHGSRLVISTV
jgi:membrane protein implicated in regulation of membrane protease activity